MSRTEKAATETIRKIDGAELAGACEGEDIADLIDLARALVLTAEAPEQLRTRAASLLQEIVGRSL